MGGNYQSRLIYLAMAATAPIAIVAATAPAYAQSAQRSYSIPSQDMGDALRAFALSSGIDVVFDPSVVAGKRSSPVAGSFTGEEALRRLIAGSGLTFRRTNSGGFAITSPSRGEGGAGSAAAEKSGDAVSVDRVGQEIVVTGSYIRGTVPSGANLIVLGREDLDNTGRGSLAEAIQATPQVHGGGANAATLRGGGGLAPNNFGISNFSGEATVNLRGLGVEETLTLVNGRRLAPAGFQGTMADISALPMAAVDRVEILADGASATYGADAMSGVVNIIMNNRFEGAETRLRAGLETRSGQPEVQASQTFGWAFDRGNFLVSASYARRDGITSKERPYAASADLRPLGGGDWRGFFCSPGNILGPADLAGAIPSGQDGRTLRPDQIRVGETNRCDNLGTGFHITPSDKTGSVFSAASYKVSDRLRVSAEILAARRETNTINYNSSPFLTVPVSNAFRQLNGLHGNEALDQPINIAYQFTDAGNRYRSDADSLIASIGADYEIGSAWEIRLDGSYGFYQQKQKSRRIDHAVLNQALASDDPATALNPFGDGSANSRGLIESLFVPNLGKTGGDYSSANMVLSGSLIDIPGGPVKVALGGDYRRENFETRDRAVYSDRTSSHAFDASREITAAYAELLIPLFSSSNSIPGAYRLSLSLSGRYDHYSDFGGTFNPKAGVSWVPARGITVKGSYGTSFKAPFLRSLYGETLAYTIPYDASLGLPDSNGDGFTEVLWIGGSNSNLKAEKGTSWNVGVEVSPTPLLALRLRATYFNLTFTGRFARAELAQIALDPGGYEGIAYFPLPSQGQVDSVLASVDEVLFGNFSGVEAIIEDRTLNFAHQVVDGVDVGASYQWDGFGGTFTLSGDATYLSRYNSRLGQSLTEVSYLNNVGLPARWKGRGGLGWASEWISLNGWVNYVSGYKNKLFEPHEPVNSYTTVDISLQAKLGAATSLSLYANNVFDKSPPFVDLFGYDGANADPVGRRIAVQLIKRW